MTRWSKSLVFAGLRSALAGIDVTSVPMLVAIAGGSVLDVRDGGFLGDGLLQRFVDRVATVGKPT